MLAAWGADLYSSRTVDHTRGSKRLNSLEAHLNAFMNVYVRVLSGPALAQLKALQAQSRATANGVGAVGQKAQWGLPFISKWGNQVQWVGRQLMYNFTLPIALAGGAATKFALENERAMVRVSKVYGDNSKQMNRVAKTEIPALREAFVALSNRFGVHQEQVIRIAGDWAAAGASGLALAKSVKLTLETMVLGELEAADATQQLIAIQAQYGYGVDQLSKTISVLNMVENQTGTTMKDLMTAMARSAGAARVAGIDIEHLAAMTAALVPAAGTAANAGNALKTIISRIMAPTKEAAEIMTEMGIAVSKTSWQSMTGAQRIEALAKGFDELSSAQRAQVATVLGSRWQLNRLIILLQAVENRNSYYNKSLKSTADAQKIFTQRQKELNMVLSSSPQRVQQAWVIIKNSMAEVIMPLLPYIAFLASKVAQLAQSFADLGMGTQKWILAGLVFLALIGPVARYVGSIASLFGILSAVLHFAGRRLLFFLIPFKLLSKALGAFVIGMKVATGAAAITSIKSLGRIRAHIALLAVAFVKLPVLIGLAMVKAVAVFKSAKLLLIAASRAVVVAFAATPIAMTAAWRAGLVTIQAMTIVFTAQMKIIWATFGASLIGIQKAITAGVVASWAFITRAMPLIAITAVKLTAAVFAGALAIFRNPWVLIALVILGVVYTFRDQLRAAWDSVVEYVAQAWSGVVDFFHQVAQGIVDAFWMLPEGVTSAFMAVLRIVQAIAIQIYEWLSYLNPFARHSPSLVESVAKGMDVIVAQYARAAGLGAVFSKAARDLAVFKKLFAEGFGDERAQVKKAGGNLDLFDSLLSDLRGITPILADLENRVRVQEAVVARWQRALDNANAALDKQVAVLDKLKTRLDRLQSLYDAHKAALDSYADAPIKGMEAMEDKIFANEMAQKKLRLEMLKFEQVHGSIDDLRSRLSALYGDIEILTGQAADLRAAGAGSDVLGPIEDQIAAMEAQARALEQSIDKSPLEKLQKELEELQIKGEILDLEKSIRFDPLIREIEKLIDTRKELTFDQIVKGIQREQAAMDKLQPRIDRLNKAIAEQQRVVDALTRARDRISGRYDEEQNKLGKLQETYQAVAEVVQELESALSKMGQVSAEASQKAAEALRKQKSEAEKAKKKTDELTGAVQRFRDAATGDWPDVGGKKKIGREGGMGDQSSWIAEWTQNEIDQMNKLLDDFDMMGPLKRKWANVKQWFKENVTPWFAGLREDITAGFRDVGEDIRESDFLAGARRQFNRLRRFVQKWIELFAPDWGRLFSGIGSAFSKAWNELGPELEKFKELGEPLRELWNELKPILTAIAVVMVGLIKISSTVFTKVFGGLLDSVVEILRGLIIAVRGAFEIILGVILGDWDLVVKGLFTLFDGVWDTLFGVARGIGRVFKNIFEGIWIGIQEFAKWLGFDVEVKEPDYGFLKDLNWEEIFGLDKLKDAWNNVFDIDINWSEKLGIDKLRESWQNIKDIFNNVNWSQVFGLDKLQQAWKNISSGKFWRENVWRPITESYNKWWSERREKFREQWGQIKNAWSNITSKKWWREKVWQPITESYNKWWPERREKFREQWGQIRSAWSNITSKKWWRENVWQPVSESFRTWWTDRRAKFREQWGQMKNAWSNITSKKWWKDNVWTPLGQSISNWWADRVRFFRSWWGLLKIAWDNLKQNVGDWWERNVMKPIRLAIIGAFAAIRTWFNSNKDKILGPIRDVVVKIANAINWVIRGINKLSELPGLKFHIPELVVQWRMAAGGEMPSRRVAGGFKTTGARAIVGEGKANWPEYVIPTDPTYRKRAQTLLQDASHRIGMAATPLHASGGILGVPQYAGGGILDSIKSAAGNVKDWAKEGYDWMKGNLKKLASTLALPLVNKARDYIRDNIDWKPARQAALWPINKIKEWLTLADQVYADGADEMSFIGAPGGPPIKGGDWERIMWRGHLFNKRTVRMIQHAEKLLGQAYHITQGSWSNYSASGGTHSGGGAFDATSPATVAGQNAARRAGFAAWLRTPSQGPWPMHIHGIALGDKQASLQARYQMQAFLRGEDGLAAQGAIIRATRGGRLMRVGEGGKDEAILPLPNNWRNGLIQTTRKQEASETHIHIHGDLSFPNIKSGDDAELFIKNIALLAKD